MVSQETKRLKSEPVEALPEPSDGGATGGSVEIKPLSEASALKRDRENATVIVRNLPLDTPVVKIRQFFRNVRVSLPALRSVFADNDSVEQSTALKCLMNPTKNLVLPR